MLFVLFMCFLCCTVNCNIIVPPSQYNSAALIKCVTDVVKKYFAPRVLTYVGNKLEDREYLKAIHDVNVVSMMSRRSSWKLPVPHEGYFISSNNQSVFDNNFPKLATESTWNPKARFLIVVKDLKAYQLKYIFNKLLQQHVFNVVVVNATADAHLYSYNPFDNYACGKRYDYITSHGKCSSAPKQNLYPNKFVTKLLNCTLNVVIPLWPPYTIIPDNDTDISSPLTYGVEPYLLKIISEKKGFYLNIILDKNPIIFSTLSSDMEAIGPLGRLQNNEADVMLGAKLLTPSRAVAFEYIYQLFPYVDEIRFAVKRASIVPAWKNIYLEFDAIVWMLIILSLILYSFVMIILLRENDKSYLVLKLLSNLLILSNNIRCKSTVKCVFIVWVWFAYLINAFYQSSLFSLMTHPAMEKQISTEEEIIQHKLKPCFDKLMEAYYLETTELQQSYIPNPSCQNPDDNYIRIVMNSSEHYFISQYFYYKYKMQNQFDDFGNSYFYLLKKPYSKVIYSMYFYKGFPLIKELRVSALRLREMGLVDKALADLNYQQQIKLHYHASDYKYCFTFPWRIHIIGSVIAIITLIVELLSKY